MKVAEKERAITLRRKGYFYSEIAKNLNISKSTAYVWTKDITLTEDEKLELKKRLLFSNDLAINRMAKAKIKLRLEKEALLKKEAENIAHNSVEKLNRDRIIASVMFWCEGSKDVSAGLKFTNSDPMMVKKFLQLLRRGFSIDESKFRVVVHLHDYHNKKLQLEFWSEVTSIPLSRFTKPYVKPHTGKRKKLITLAASI